MPRLRIVLDECIDRRFTGHIKDFAVRTVPEMGWSGLSNGELLSRAQSEFDVFLTTDRNLSFQQNLSLFALAIAVMHAPTNRLDELIPLIPALLEALPTMQPGTSTEISS